MSIQHFPIQFQANQPLVDQNGIPITKTGRPFFLGLFNRSGAGNGIVPSVSAPLAATGSTIVDALPLDSDWNDIESGGVAAGVAISAALNLQPGNDIWVFNGSGSNKNVFPPSATVQIDRLGAGNPFILADGKLRCFQCWSTGVAGGIVFRSYGN